MGLWSFMITREKRWINGFFAHQNTHFGLIHPSRPKPGRKPLGVQGDAELVQPRPGGPFESGRSKCYDPVMLTEQIVALLVTERNRLDAAILALQGPIKRRGRPPKATAAAVTAPAPVPRKRRMSAAGRKAIADAARKRWAAIKAGKAPSPFTKANRRGVAKG